MTELAGQGLLANHLRILRSFAQEDSIVLGGRDLNLGRDLARRGYLELLPGCVATFELSDKGRELVFATEVSS